VCKTCDALYRKNNKDKLRKYSHYYYQQNKQDVNNQRLHYRASNKEKIAQADRKYYKINKDKISAQKKLYYTSCVSEFIARVAKRKAHQLQATPSWADKKSIAGIYYLATLFNDTGIKLHVDHIVPLQSDVVCGLHCEANLQLLPASDNISKSNRWWPDMW
jgi:hypothetical protein